MGTDGEDVGGRFHLPPTPTLRSSVAGGAFLTYSIIKLTLVGGDALVAAPPYALVFLTRFFSLSVKKENQLLLSEYEFGRYLLFSF